ncbi:MAG TPA: hypothetical protein V6C65_25055, partial [Allocoleopsis sp.]
KSTPTPSTAPVLVKPQSQDHNPSAALHPDGKPNSSTQGQSAPAKPPQSAAQSPQSSEDAQDLSMQPDSAFPKVDNIKFDRAEMHYLAPQTDPDPTLEQAILQAMPDYKGEMPEGFEIRYTYNRVDLDGDRTPEVLVYLSGYYTCGSGGCTMMVFQPKGEGYQLVSQVRLVNAPVLVSDQATAGWQDLILYVAGGGVEPHYAMLQYDGKGYPLNPSLAPDVPNESVLKGTAILTESTSFGDGALLAPPASGRQG